MATRLETPIAANAKPAPIVIKESKAHTCDMSGRHPRHELGVAKG